MEGHKVGTVFCEVGADFEPYTRAQKKLLQDVTSTNTNIEKSFKDLNVKSSAEFDLLRVRVEKSFQAISSSAMSTANDILRAEKAKNDQLTRLNEQQFGSQKSGLDTLKSHYLAVTAAIAGSVAMVSKAWALVKEGAAFDQQQTILDNLSRKYGTTATALVSAMDKSSEAVIAKADLMQTALAGVAKGLSPEQLINLAGAAHTLGEVVGKDATTSLKELTEALETGRVKGLKGYLGSALDLEKTFGDLVSKMNAAEKSQAMYNMTMIQATKIQGEQKGEVDETIDRIENIEKRWKDATLSVAQYFKTLAVGIAGTLDLGGSEGWSAPFDLPPTDLSGGPNIVRMKMPSRPPDSAAAAAKVAAYEAEQAAIKAQVQARKDAEDAAKKSASASETLQKERARLELKARSGADQGQDWLYAPVDEKGSLEVMNRSQEKLNKILDERLKLEEKARAGGDQAQDWLYGPTDEKMALKVMEQSVAKMGAYREYNLAALQAMLNDTATTEENKRKVMEEVNRRVKEDSLGTYDSMKLGWTDTVMSMRGKFQSTAQYVMDFGKEMANSLQSSMSDTFYAAFTGKLDSIKDIWGSFTSSLKNTFFRMVSDIAAKKILMMFTAGWAEDKPVFGSKGTIETLLGIDVPVLTFAGGGSVPGSWNGRGGYAGDSVPAVLTPGEYVMRREVAQDPAMGALIRAINGDAGGFGSVAGGKNIPGFSEGGIVAPWLPHFGFFSKMLSTFSGGLSDVSGITKGGGYLPGFGDYAADLMYGRKNFDFFSMLSRVAEPSGFVHGATRGLGAVAPDEFATAAGYIGPIIGGIIGTVYGGPGLGSAWGAYVGSKFASEWQLGNTTGQTNPKDEREMQQTIQASIAAASAYVASEASSYVKTSYGGVAKVPEGSLYTDAVGQTWMQEAGTGAEWAVTRATPYEVAAASLNGAWERASQMGTDFATWVSSLSDMSAGDMWSRASGAMVDYLGASWDKLANLPSYLFDQVMNFDPMTYVKSRATDIMKNIRIGLSGMSGGELLDTPAMASALGIGQMGVASYETGTGLGGLPYTGPFIGHKGEIVKSKPESDRERRGSGDLVIHNYIQLDGRLVDHFETRIKKGADDVRVNAERRNMGTRRIY